MFGSTNPFGQSSSNPSSNPFAPSKPTPFGSQTGGGSIFGATSTGVFGVASSPLASTSTFGAPSSPAFGSSMPAFGASSTPAFGTSSSSFGGSSIFGQKPSFGGFGSSPSQPNSFGSAFQQSQSAFGGSTFGSSTLFGAPSQHAFGSASTPAFGATSTPAFGATSTPAFGSTSTPTFGSTGTAFGVPNAPAFGSGGAFGASSTPTFGSSSTPAFGASSTPAFGAASTPAFGASSTPGFSFGSTPAFGQSTSTFGSSNLFGTNPSPFGTQSSPFGSQSTAPTSGSTGFGQSAFGGQRGGSRVVAYTATAEVDGGSGTQPAGKLESISAMPVYKDKSHEELRWEDYQLGDKGGPNPAGQSAGGIGLGASTTPSNPFSPSPTFGQSSANLFSSTSSNPFAPKTPAFGASGFGTSSTPAFSSSPFSASSSANPFGTTSSSTPSIFGTASAPAFGANTSPSLFGISSSPAFGSSPSIFSSASAPGTAPAFGSGSSFANTRSSPLFQSVAPSLGQTNAAFGQSTAPSFGQLNIFGTPSTGSGFGGNLFSSTQAVLSSSNPVGFGQTTPSFSTPFKPAQPAQPAGTFSISNFGQPSAGSSGFGGVSGILGQGTLSQPSAPQSTLVVQPSPVTSPFGALPAMPQMSIGRSGSTPSIQYGISSMPVSDKLAPAPARISSLLTSRHFSQRRIRLPTRKYHPESDDPKVPFFSNDEETPSTPKADALFIPRENPRALVIRPTEQWPLRANAEKMSLLKDASTRVHENGKLSARVSTPAPNGSIDQDKDENPSETNADKERTSSVKPNLKPNGVHEVDYSRKGGSYITHTGHRAGEGAIVSEHGADVEALMPKLRRFDYYTEPQIQELAAKERAEPGFCRCVKDFVVGRHAYGSIKFVGETDVQQLDLDSLVQFNNREVIVYMDETKKPRVGQGLNKPAEVTLLNIKCFDKKTGEQYIDGPKVDKYREMLMKKAKHQGAEFVSYDPASGEWKFSVQHFSQYRFRDEDKYEGDFDIYAAASSC